MHFPLYPELKQEAHETGVIMGEEMVEGGQRLHDAMDKLSSSWDAAKMTLAAAFAPLLEKVADLLAKMNPKAVAFIAVIAGIAAVFIQVASALKVLSLATAMQTATQGAFNTISTKTVVIVLAVLAALIAVAAIIGFITGQSDDLEKTMDKTAKTSQKYATGIQDSLSGQQQKINSVGRNASGTSYWEGGATWVGEEGPELVNLPRGSRITPASETYNNAVNNYYITIDAKNVSDFNRVVELAKQQQMAIRRT